MTLRFSEYGPPFPAELVDSLLAGEVVFVCGAGVSAPQMPGFRCLVDRTYEELRVERPASEGSGRPEEILGSLARRLADRTSVTRTVSALLETPECPDLKQHETIIRLSRDLDNRILVVTTNFDTLLERAALQGRSPKKGVAISSAGQDLPAPGSVSFSGIIHLHGRIGDETLGLQSTPLVLTSADYGDAYMRSGWASRFLFDLARCKSIVLVGYAGDDAPVRYFLNVLESDRERFSDLKPVYALSSYESDREEAYKSWGTLPVEVLAYCRINPDSGVVDHSTLWRGLEALAEIAERPQRSRRQRTEAILSRSAAEADSDALAELRWLFGGRRDLWSTALRSIDDPEWFDVFGDVDLWSDEDACWIVAAWIGKDFRDPARLYCACEWQRVLGDAFTDQIERRLQSETELGDFWTRMWRFFGLMPARMAYDAACYAAQQRLRSGVVLESDLREAIQLLAPSLVLQRPYGEPSVDNPGQAVTRLSDIIWPRMEVADPDGAEEILGCLAAMPDRSGRVLDLATAALASVLELQVELELIAEDYDVNDSEVPSVERHEQNRHGEGLVFLVRLLADCLARVAASDPEHARRVACGWQALPGRLGMRMCMHAMRNAELFDADEAISTLLSASETEFWTIRREAAFLLKDRAGTANPELVAKVTKRVCGTGESHYGRFRVGAGEPDWREHARDAAVWLRLKMLKSAGALPESGAAELTSIECRRTYLDREAEDRDLFGSYISGPQVVVGDAATIIEAPEDDRLRVALQLARAPGLASREGWSAFCRSDPDGAFDSLCKEELTQANGPLWEQFLNALPTGDEDTKAARGDLAVRAFRHLSGVDADALAPMVSGLCAALRFAPRQQLNDIEAWLEKLWMLVSERPGDVIDLSTDIYQRAINSSAGKLAETLLLEMDSRRRGSLEPAASHGELARLIARTPGAAGQLGCAVLAIDVAFLLSFDSRCVVDVLGARITHPGAEGAALRAVMLKGGSLTPAVSRTLREAVMLGMLELRSTRPQVAVASKLLRPALAEVRKDRSVGWGLDTVDVARLLRDGPPTMREGALAAMSEWLKTADVTAEEMWGASIGPLFQAVWPKEREFRDSACTHRLVELAVRAGGGFRAALDVVRPYLVPYDGGYARLGSLAASGVAGKFPHETLALVWLVCGPGSRAASIGIAEVIDQLIAAEPAIEVDRRLQWLERHAERLE